MSIWLAGMSPYEVSGVEATLASRAIRGLRFCPGSRLMPGDMLVLCISDTPLSGWWRYLRLIQWLSERYGGGLIVLCPPFVYSTEIICGKNIVTINGSQGIEFLSEELFLALQKFWNEEVTSSRYRCDDIRRFWQEAFMCLLENHCRNSARRACYRRVSLFRYYGVDSLHHFRVFMSGFRLERRMIYPESFVQCRDQYYLTTTLEKGGMNNDNCNELVSGKRKQSK